MKTPPADATWRPSGKTARVFITCFPTWDDRDYRKQVALDDTTLVEGVVTAYPDFTNEKRPHIAKFTRLPGSADLNNRYTDHNYPCFRYAEVLLIAAEALAEMNSGANDEAIGYVNQIRTRARNWAGIQTDFPANYSVGDFGSKDAFVDAILEERRLELSFEFKRWYDIKRRDLGVKVFTGPNSLEPHSFDPNIHYLMPLPGDELSRNPNLEPQNTGY